MLLTIITSTAEKVVRPWPDRPYRRLRPWATHFKFGTQLCIGNAERAHK